jgi:adenylate cyclase
MRDAASIAKAQAEMAFAIDPRNADAHAAIGFAQFLSGHKEIAVRHFDVALSINPNNVVAQRGKGMSLVLGGQPAEGRQVLLAVLRLNPRDPSSTTTQYQIGESYYYEGNYDAAVDAVSRAIASNPGYPHPYRWLAAALGQLGRKEEAAAALRHAIEAAPQLFRELAAARPPQYRQEDYDHMLDGLRKAGWQA